MVTQAQWIRDSIMIIYITPARAAGRHTVIVDSGTLGQELGLRDRFPNICSAMRGRILELQTNVRTEVIRDTPSGESSTIQCRYTIL